MRTSSPVGTASFLAAFALMLLMVAPAAGQSVPPSARLQPVSADATQPSSGPIRRRAHVPFVPDRDALRAGKAAAALRRGPASGAEGGVAANAVVVGGLNQPGLGATDNSLANQGTPPDTTGAIGTHPLRGVREQQGRRVQPDLLSAWCLRATSTRSSAVPARTSSTRRSSGTQQGGRWLYVADRRRRRRTATSSLSAGRRPPTRATWSAAGAASRSRPTSAASRFLEDYPKLGHDNRPHLIGSNSITRELVLHRARLLDSEARERGHELHGAVGRHRVRLPGKPAHDVGRRSAFYSGPREYLRQRRGGLRGRSRLPVLRRQPEPGHGLARRRHARPRPPLIPDGNLNVDRRLRFRQTFLSRAPRT